MSFPAFSGFFPILIAAAAAAPGEFPTCIKHALRFSTVLEKPKKTSSKINVEIICLLKKKEV